jgi:SAM-dependent methyltransferase
MARPISRPAKHDAVRRFLQTAGITKQKRYSDFATSLTRKHGAIGERCIRVFSDRVDYSEADDVYDVKNQTLGVALDCASQFTADQYRAYLDWFVDANISPSGPIIDLGCDIGICTCFYASQHPDLSVIGLDNHESSVRIAIELAEKLQLRNVRFVCGDFMEPPITELAEIKAGLICSTLTVYENVTGERDQDILAFSSLVDAIAARLKRGGILVSVEPTQLPTWFETIADHLRPEPSERLTFFDAMGQVAEVTAMTATRD